MRQGSLKNKTLISYSYSFYQHFLYCASRIELHGNLLLRIALNLAWHHLRRLDTGEALKIELSIFITCYGFYQRVILLIGSAKVLELGVE